MLNYTSDSSAEAVTALKGQIEALSHKPKAVVVQADLSKLESPKKIVEAAKQLASGDLKLDILVNNAGTGVVKTLSEFTIEDYNYTFDLNMRGLIFMTQAVLPHLQPNSRIVNIGSIGARSGGPTLFSYSATKAGMEAVTRCWAKDLGHNGTTVNTVCPGPVETDLLTKLPAAYIEFQKSQTAIQKRTGKVSEIADIVAYLAGPSSSWISGQAISASGGYVMW